MMRIDIVLYRRMLLFSFLVLMGVHGDNSFVVNAKAHRILLDTDVDTDDFFALFYLLKQNRSQIDLKAITISANGWSDVGHAINHVYDMLFMMNRDDILVGAGGDGGILDDSTILPDVGGYLPLIEQGISTAGDCRYRQAIPVGASGRLSIDTNYGLRKRFLPQGQRRYFPLEQPTAQQVMIDTISTAPTTLFLTGSLTNTAVFLMTYPHLKKNIEHIYVMGGGIKSTNACTPQQDCGGPGNIFTAYSSNPFAEFNMFADPFSAYQVLHSGIPVTLVPLDATNTIPINEEFFNVFQQQQETFEAQYCFKSLKIIRDSWVNDNFYTSFFMWDSFLAGVAESIMRSGDQYDGANEFAEMEYLNLTVVTSNPPYGADDGSNPFFDGRRTPKFNLQRGGVHSGHVQDGLFDPFCFVNSTSKGKCQDGYTKEVTGPEAVKVRVAMRAKPNQDIHSPLNRQFFKSFLEMLNLPQQSGRFNLTTQFPYYSEILYKPTDKNQTRGKPVVFDMDMSAGDFLALLYLLKAPVEAIDLKGILVSGNGWASVATIDVVYDVLHMMGRDDVPVGLGNVTAMGAAPGLGCGNGRAVPQGSGGVLDSDTLYGLARSLPKSSRGYTAENSVKFGAPRDTDCPALRQALAHEVWQSISKSVRPRDKITVLTNGPLTNLADIIERDKDATRIIQEVYVVGGQIIDGNDKAGNIFTVPSNKFAEFNMFLDPLAAKKVIMESNLSITLVPLSAQQKATSFQSILQTLEHAKKTPESKFAHQLLSLLYKLQRHKSKLYHHMEIFLGEVLGAVLLVDGDHKLNTKMQMKPVKVLAGDLSLDGQIKVDKYGKVVRILDDFSSKAYYRRFASLLGHRKQSAVIGSFDEQKKMWRKPNNGTVRHAY